jgi:hypothetical protein
VRDEAEAAAQSGQYPRWRRRDETVWLPGGSAPNTRRHAWTRARTTRLSMLTHLSPTFGPGMGRPDRVCPFASARWSVFSPFFYPREHVQMHAGRMSRPARDTLRGKTPRRCAVPPPCCPYFLLGCRSAGLDVLVSVPRCLFAFFLIFGTPKSYC